MAAGKKTPTFFLRNRMQNYTLLLQMTRRQVLNFMSFLINVTSLPLPHALCTPLPLCAPPDLAIASAQPLTALLARSPQIG